MDLLDTNTKVLAQLGTEAISQRKHLQKILEETQADFQWTKVMTFVATVHLPANLLAVSTSYSTLAMLTMVNADTSRRFSLPTLCTFPRVQRTVKLCCFRSGTQWGSMLPCPFSLRVWRSRLLTFGSVVSWSQPKSLKSAFVVSSMLLLSIEATSQSSLITLASPRWFEHSEVHCT